ncbi:hypothetical protein [Vibrio brasiliensis]|uniref:hypothetical protein n=1 Tax=Vibrio brasiliensis TaxID=170652 RepID=UPI001EFEB508|nr:hypothetical protein [Vibrio brasiliensis]MCG9727440.1 hypothetical protein [Vibrio brasiliensis]
MSAISLIKLVLVWLFVCGITNFDGEITTLVTLGIAISYYSHSKWVNRRRVLELTDDRKEQIKKIMKEPSPLEVTDYEEKIRRNLIIGSSIAILFTLLGLKLSPSSRFLGGIQFENLTPEIIYYTLLAVIVYESIHYFWLIKNKFQLWRIRLTGTGNVDGVRPQMGTYSQGVKQVYDYGGLTKNSNFYTWMFELEPPIKDSIAIWEEKCSSIDESLFTEAENSPSYYSAQQKLVKEMVDATERLTQALENTRINTSMVAFDNWYDQMVKSQSRRWLFLDVLLPGILSLSALALISLKLYS